jgi:mono/diheme cytochrome c family protein
MSRISTAALVLTATVCLRAAPTGGDVSSIPDIVEHFKYGSIGAEENSGVPSQIWKVLPDICGSALPNRPGTGFERLGFISEGSTHQRPIGTSFRKGNGDRIGLNCATCHVGTLRDVPDAPRRVSVGMPANQMDLQAYGRFLTACAKSPAFETGALIEAIRKNDPDFGFFSRLAFRLFIVRATRDGILERERENAWFDTRPPFGPGRVDTFNPYKVLLRLPVDATVGTVDLPSIWNQRPRQGLWLHWDGNNDRVEERNKSAAIGAGATPKSLDLASMRRIEDWLLDFPAPSFPAERIDATRAAAGRAVYGAACASCHDIGAPAVGQVTPIAEIGTDPGRLESFTPALATAMNTIGRGRPWAFSHFRKTQGYANMPLDGLWLRAPYLHNGSVPDLRALLFPAERPATFFRAYDVYDWDRIGFVSAGPGAEREGVRFDTALRGNGNAGHLYGTELSTADKLALLEYLKTL